MHTQSVCLLGVCLLGLCWVPAGSLLGPWVRALFKRGYARNEVRTGPDVDFSGEDRARVEVIQGAFEHNHTIT